MDKYRKYLKEYDESNIHSEISKIDKSISHAKLELKKSEDKIKKLQSLIDDIKKGKIKVVDNNGKLKIIRK